MTCSAQSVRVGGASIDFSTAGPCSFTHRSLTTDPNAPCFTTGRQPADHILYNPGGRSVRNREPGGPDVQARKVTWQPTASCAATAARDGAVSGRAGTRHPDRRRHQGRDGGGALPLVDDVEVVEARVALHERRQLPDALVRGGALGV